MSANDAGHDVSRRSIEVVARSDDHSVPATVHGPQTEPRRRPGEPGRRKRVRTTSVAWYGHAKLTRSEWESYGSRLGLVTKSSNWWLGDWVRFGQRHYNDHRFEFAARITGYDEQTLRNFAYVSGRCEFSRRRENLSWSHHAEVAPLEPAQQDRWLEDAATGRWSVRQLRERVRRERLSASSAGEPNVAVSPEDPSEAECVDIRCDHCGSTIHVPVSAMAGILGNHRSDPRSSGVDAESPVSVGVARA